MEYITLAPAITPPVPVPIVKSPVIVPPVLALRELFALAKAPLAYMAAEFATELGVFAATPAELAAIKAALDVSRAYWSLPPPPPPAFAVYCRVPSPN